jgi:hypothetical protein
MMSSPWLLGVMATSLSASACVSVETRNGTLHDRLRARAAFDAQCPAEALKITDLNSSSSGIVTAAGVEGCGRRSTYVLDAISGAWILNAVDGQPTGNTNDHARKEANQ